MEYVYLMLQLARTSLRSDTVVHAVFNSLIFDQSYGKRVEQQGTTANILRQKKIWSSRLHFWTAKARVLSVLSVWHFARQAFCLSVVMLLWLLVLDSSIFLLKKLVSKAIGIFLRLFYFCNPLMPAIWCTVTHHVETSSPCSATYMIPLETLKDPSSGFLINDSCILGVEFIKVVTVKTTDATSESLLVQSNTFNECILGSLKASPQLRVLLHAPLQLLKLMDTNGTRFWTSNIYLLVFSCFHYPVLLSTVVAWKLLQLLCSGNWKFTLNIGLPCDP